MMESKSIQALSLLCTHRWGWYLWAWTVCTRGRRGGIITAVFHHWSVSSSHIHRAGQECSECHTGNLKVIFDPLADFVLFKQGTCLIVFKRRRHFLLLLSSQDILNHILSDIEIFMGQIAAAVAKNAKKKKKKNKGNLGQKMKAEHIYCKCLTGCDGFIMFLISSCFSHAPCSRICNMSP